MFDALCSSVRCWSCNTRQCCSLLPAVPKHQRSTAIIYYNWRHTHTHMQTNPFRAEEASLYFNKVATMIAPFTWRCNHHIFSMYKLKQKVQILLKTSGVANSTSQSVFRSADTSDMARLDSQEECGCAIYVVLAWISLYMCSSVGVPQHVLGSANVRRVLYLKLCKAISLLCNNDRFKMIEWKYESQLNSAITFLFSL